MGMKRRRMGLDHRVGHPMPFASTPQTVPSPYLHPWGLRPTVGDRDKSPHIKGEPITPAWPPFRFRGVVPRWGEVYRVKSHERPTRVKEVVARFVSHNWLSWPSSACEKHQHCFQSVP